MQPGVLRENAAKAEALIAQTLAEEPDNPLALHLHIHISEASNPLRSALQHLPVMLGAFDGKQGTKYALLPLKYLCSSPLVLTVCIKQV